MALDYLAHCTEDRRTETVYQHLMQTAKLASFFSSSFGAEEQGYLAGIAHDIGKYSDAFQRRLKGDLQKVDHSTAGAVECVALGQAFAAFVVAGHHGGLPDGGGPGDHVDQPTLYGRLNRARKGLLEPYEAWKREITLPQAALPPYQNFTQADAMFFTRMLYSCLVDADFLCTEEFMLGKKREHAPLNMEKLEKRLVEYVSSWNPPKGALNELRCQILERCRQMGVEKTPGLFTMTVPTGGGKTVSSLAFALAHARACGLQRIIYVIPYTSIIEQNAEVFREILGEEVVLEHHSGVLCDLEHEADPASIRMAQATENWDMPVIVTTAVQFFDSLFANRSSRCRKLHNLAKSVIIFDEAQMLPLPYLRPCVFAIAQLVKHYKASTVLCTATQPALKPIFQEFLLDVAWTELCPEEVQQAQVFHRVTFQRVDRLTWDQLAEELNARAQVLCIVNSRKAAQEVYQRLRGEGCYHLSTLMYPEHRVHVLAEIRCRLKEGLPCRVVSTTLIEAGVDVDFPELFREEAGLDSILQAAGRCNREGKRPVEQSIVTIFQGETPPPKLFSKAIGACRTAMGKTDDIASREAVATYFQELLDLNGQQAQDQQRILPMMEQPNYPFAKIADCFHLIDSSARTIYIPLEEGSQLTKQLQQGEHSRALFRRLNRYGVTVYEDQFRSLEADGALEILEDGSAILLDMTLYHPDTGLARRAESGNGLFI